MKKMSGTVIQLMEKLPMMHWKTFDPFLFCAYHQDNFPQSASNLDSYEGMGVDPKLLRNRELGSDFSGLNGFSMYHGEVVPGFPSHPHYGFETVSIVRKGLVDHSDSWGATARYGEGDAQWLTTGSGIQHAEMFPLVNHDKPNPGEMFQIWLNLPSYKKKSKPFFSMAWAEDQPIKSFGEPGKQAHVRVIGGNLAGLKGVPPPPDSYASEEKSELIIATLKLEPGATFKIPPASSSDINRAVYFFNGSSVSIENKTIKDKVTMVKLAADREAEIKCSGSDTCELLLLQGRPINEPVVQQGPFVTNSREELAQVFQDYRRTQFGGWKWGRHDPVHSRKQGRFYEINGAHVDAPSVRQLKSDVEQKEDSIADSCKIQNPKIVDATPATQKIVKN